MAIRHRAVRSRCLVEDEQGWCDEHPDERYSQDGDPDEGPREDPAPQSIRPGQRRVSFEFLSDDLGRRPEVCQGRADLGARGICWDRVAQMSLNLISKGLSTLLGKRCCESVELVEVMAN